MATKKNDSHIPQDNVKHETGPLHFHKRMALGETIDGQNVDEIVHGAKGDTAQTGQRKGKNY